MANENSDLLVEDICRPRFVNSVGAILGENLAVFLILATYSRLLRYCMHFSTQLSSLKQRLLRRGTGTLDRARNQRSEMQDILGMDMGILHDFEEHVFVLSGTIGTPFVYRMPKGKIVVQTQ